MSKSRILVIDPDPPSCKLVTSILKASGFEAISASDGRSGIKAAQDSQPTVIILEMILPDADGVDTCQRLKQDPALERVPVIGMTTSTDGKYQERAFRAGVEFFLTKPFRPPSLLQLVQLAVKSAEQSARQPATKSAGRGTQESKVRRHPRFPAQVPIKCVVGPDTASPREIEGQTGNVCLGGVLLWLHEELEKGTVLHMRVDLPKGTITVEGNVAWQDAHVMGGVRGHGIKLVRFMEDSDVARYKNFLSDLAAATASSGLEFLDLPEEMRQGICEYIESVSEEAKASPVDGGSIRRSYTCEKCGKSFELSDSEVRPVTVEPQKRPVQAGDQFQYNHGKCQGYLMYVVGGPFSPWTGS